MADLYRINKTTLDGIANAIREKTDKTTPIAVTDMPAEIRSIQTGIEPTDTIYISENKTYDVETYKNAVVSVPVPSNYMKIPTETNPNKITSNGRHNVVPWAYVDVDVPPPSNYMPIPTQTKPDTIVSNGEYDVTEWAKVNVQIKGSGTKTITTIGYTVLDNYYWRIDVQPPYFEPSGNITIS